MADDTEEQEVPNRYQTLSLSKIDEDYLSQLVDRNWRESANEREDFLTRREEWMANWRSLQAEPKEGPWEDSANFHVPLTLTYGKAIHARLWQLFSDRSGFFAVAARREVNKDKEMPVKEFMDWIWTYWANRKQGCKDVMDDFLWNVVFDGSGYLKLYWHRERNEYLDSVPVKDISEKLIFDRINLTGRVEQSVKLEEEDELREEVFECPMISTLEIEDVVTPVGQPDPQLADYVICRSECSDEQLKVFVENGRFDRDAVEFAIQHRSSRLAASSDPTTAIKELREQIDGDQAYSPYTRDNCHVILEWYGKAYIEKEYVTEDEKDLDKFPQEVVVWVHQATRKVLGWTYLYRISPSGLRPIFKADLLRFPGRNVGVGVGELLSDIQLNTDALYNMRIDNGTIASIPMGFYRASSGLKADVMRIAPGTLYPVDDIADIRFGQFPYLQGFGQQEEAQLTNYAEKLLTVSDLQMGLAPQKVGALRNATGSNLIASESGIQLEIHFDRLARTLDKILQSLFRLCRQRMPEELYYRVTGDRGQHIFGKVNKDDLRGEYDFQINVDILGQSRLEKQQAATLKMQTLINPVFLQTGVVGPRNLYALAKDFLRAYKTERIDEYLTPPPDYQGDMISAAERFYRIAVGQLEGLADTVRLNEDHEKALQIYEAFKSNDTYYGMLNRPEQVAALEQVIERHMQMLAAQQNQGQGMVNNVTGMQVPQGGMPALEGVVGGGGGSLQGQMAAQGMGTPQGPVV